MLFRKNLFGLIAAIAISFIPPMSAEGKGSKTNPLERDRYEDIYDRTILGRSLTSYFQTINSGWKGNFLTLKKYLNPQKSYMVIHALEPRNPMDLRSAENFRRSIMAIGIFNLSNSSVGIGHVFTSWHCNIKGQIVEGATGMTGENEDQFNKLSSGGWGMASFFTNFEDGHLQTPELLEMEWEEPMAIHSLAVEVDENICANAVGFVKKFLFHPNSPKDIFGLSPDPEKFEGGGCGSFSVSVLNQSKLFGNTGLTSSFWRNVSTKKSLFGYGLEVPEDAIPYQLEKVGSKSVNHILMMATSWDGDGPSLRIMDPEMVLLFLKTTYRSSIGDLYEQSVKQARELKSSPLYAYRIISVAQEGPSAELPINGNFDAQAGEVVRKTKEWIASLRAKGYKARPAYSGIPSRPLNAVILEKN